MARRSKEAQRLLQEALDKGKNCPHPPDKRSTLGYGIYCDLCKNRVGLISEAEAMKAIMDFAKSMGAK